MVRTFIVLLFFLYTLPNYAETFEQSIAEDEKQEEEAKTIKAIELYSEPQLLNYIRRGVYLQRVRLDRCQIVADIRDHAQIMKQPAYQYLYAEMLIYGVCVRKDRPRGINMLRDSVRQGLPEAMLRLAQYYDNSTILVPNQEKSVRLSFAASKAGNVRGRLMLVRLLLEGYGSPQMYPQAYEWLYHSTFNSPVRQKEALILLAKMEKILPFYTVEHIQNRPEDEF